MKLRKLSLLIVTFLLISVFPAAVSADGADPYEMIDALSYDSTSDASLHVKTTYVAMNGRSYNHWICFKNVNFTLEPTAVVIYNAVAQSEIDKGDFYQIRLDDPKSDPITTIEIKEYGGWHTPMENIGNISQKITGIHDVYVLTNQANNLHGIYFIGKDADAFKYSTYSPENVFDDVAGHKYAKEINTLAGLGVAEAFNENFFYPEIPLSRARFASMLAKLIADEIPVYEESVFSDVSVESEVHNAVNMLYERGILTLNSEKTFNPWAFIKAKDACAMVLRYLGYEQLCQYKGGYPSGYTAMAYQMKLASNLNMEGDLRHADAIKLLYNAMEADYLEVGGVVNEGISYETKKNILESTRNIYKSTGVVTKTAFSGISDTQAADTGTCYIEGEQFFSENVSAELHLGVKCDYLYKYDSVSGRKTLLYLAPSAKNEEILLNSFDYDFTKIASTQISYLNDNDKEIIENISKKATWVYNNKVYSGEISDIVNPDTFRGRIRVVDNGSGDWETVIVEEYMNIKLQSFDSSDVKFTDELTGKNYDFTDKTIILTDGVNPVLKNKIKVGQIAEFYMSIDEEIGILIFKESSVRGIASEINSDGKVIVNNETYSISNELKDPVIPGSEYIYHINSYDEIVWIENVSGAFNVGILSDLYEEENKAYISLITATATLTDFEVADKIFVDGVRMREYEEMRDGKGSASGIKAVERYSPVLYSLDSDGRIVMIDTIADGALNEYDTLNVIAPYDSSVNYDYRSYTGNFTNNATFALDRPVNSDATIIFMNDTDKVGSCFMTKLQSLSVYYGQPYAFYSSKRNSKISDIVINPHCTKYNSQGYQFVISSNDAVNKEGKKGVNLYTVSSEGKKSYWVSDENSYLIKQIKSLKTGDCINIITGSDGMVSSISGLVFFNLESANAGGVSAKLSSATGLNGNTNFSDNLVLGTVVDIKDGFYEIAPFGSSNNVFVKLSGKKMFKVSSEYVTYGHSSDAVRPGDLLLVYYNYGYKWSALFE